MSVVERGSQPLRVKDKVVVIAGAGGKQGTTSAVLFAREGASVVLAGLDGDEVERLARHIEAQGDIFVVLGVDVRRTVQVHRLSHQRRGSATVYTT